MQTDENPSLARVMRALSWRRPDRVPHFDSYWDEFVENWRVEKGLGPDASVDDAYDVDIRISAPDETAWPTRAGVLRENGDEIIRRDGWGQLKRQRRDGFFSEVLEAALQDKPDLATVAFDPPALDSRYEKTDAQLTALKKRYAVFGKVGGPYLRSSFMMGTQRFLLEVALDPTYVRELADRVADHLIAIGTEQIRRGALESTGIWIYDDIAANRGLMVSPDDYEKLFLPGMERMVRAYKQAGASKVIMHSDGNIEAVLDMLVAIGIDAINPVEPRAGMCLADLFRKYRGRLALVGGMCNSVVLPAGSPGQIERHVAGIVELGRDGGVILGGHSIGPDIPVGNYDLAMDVYRRLRQ